MILFRCASTAVQLSKRKQFKAIKPLDSTLERIRHLGISPDFTLKNEKRTAPRNKWEKPLPTIIKGTVSVATTVLLI